MNPSEALHDYNEKLEKIDEFAKSTIVKLENTCDLAHDLIRKTATQRLQNLILKLKTQITESEDAIEQLKNGQTINQELLVPINPCMIINLQNAVAYVNHSFKVDINPQQSSDSVVYEMIHGNFYFNKLDVNSNELKKID